MTTEKCNACKEQLSRDTERAYYWLAKNRSYTGKGRGRGKALETLRLRILRRSSFTEIVDELGGSTGEHSARCAWAREMHRRAIDSGSITSLSVQELFNTPLEAYSPGRRNQRARGMVARAIRRGNLSAPKYHLCACCNKVFAQEYHHEDYNRPLDVTPICKKCHWKLHEEANRNGRSNQK